MAHKVFISKEEFSEMTLALCKKIAKTKIRFYNVYGIERGGIYVSKPVSKHLLADHRSFKISFYSDEDRLNAEPVYDFGRNDFEHIKKTAYSPFLICEDLIDSGSTLSFFIKRTGLIQGKDFYLASLYYNKSNGKGIKPDFWINEKKEDEWIVFPHEVEEDTLKMLKASA